jgi:hypothetical protein
VLEGEDGSIALPLVWLDNIIILGTCFVCS